MELPIYKSYVQDSWLDHNGHMNDAYYAVAFSQALDALMAKIGIDDKYINEAKKSIFTLQAQICYLNEALKGEEIYATFQILGFDRKRMHVFFKLYKQIDNTLLATSEQMLLHVDMTVRKGASFDDFVGKNILNIWQQQKEMEIPHQAGRTYMQLTNKIDS